MAAQPMEPGLSKHEAFVQRNRAEGSQALLPGATHSLFEGKPAGDVHEQQAQPSLRFFDAAPGLDQARLPGAGL